MPTQIHSTVSSAPAWEIGLGHYDPPQAGTGERMRSITELVRQVQIVALLITLDKQLISGDADFREEIEKLTALLFPRHFDTTMIERRFRFLGQTLSNQGKGSKHTERHHVFVTEEELDRYVAARPLSQFGETSRAWLPTSLSLNMTETYGDALYSYQSSLEKLQEYGRLVARADLGIPSETQNLEGDDRYFLNHAMSRSDAQVMKELELEEFLPKYDRIVVGAAMDERDHPKALAIQRANVITLYPCFFGMMNIFQRDNKVTAISPLTIDKLVLRPLQVLIHEYFHTNALGATADVKVLHSTISSALQINPSNKSYNPNQLEMCHSFGTNMLLAALDNCDDGARAEDNADSWARYAQFYLAIVAYPEYDFLSGPRPRLRNTLLHHCSLLDCLRVKPTGSVRSLRGYSASKDHFTTEEAFHQPSQDSSKLLEKMLELTNRDGHARSLKEILRELDVRTESDPVRKIGELKKREPKSKHVGNDAEEINKQLNSPTPTAPELISWNSLQRDVLLTEIVDGRVMTQQGEGLEF